MKSDTRVLIEIILLIALTLFVSSSFILDPAKDSATVVKDSPEQAQPLKIDIENSGAAPYPGFYIYPQSGNEEVHLINQAGEILHKWEFDAGRARLLPNCNLLVVHGSKWGLMREPWRSLRHVSREYTWDGKLVAETQLPGPGHHEARKLTNGNILTLYRAKMPEEYKRKLKNSALHNLRIRSDGIIEITPEGEIVWEWLAHEHLDINSCGKETCPKPKAKVKSLEKEYDWTHANSVSELGPNKWFDAGDKRFHPRNIITLLRTWSTVMIIDRETKEVVWTYSGDYKGGLSGGHESYMIPKGLPGAGNILIFDNGRDKGASIVLEVSPDTKKVVWKYENDQNFYSEVAGFIQRLPNGNTLVSEDYRSRLFQVSPDGKVVWKHEGEFRTCRPELYEANFCPKLKELAEAGKL